MKVRHLHTSVRQLLISLALFTVGLATSFLAGLRARCQTSNMILGSSQLKKPRSNSMDQDVTASVDIDLEEGIIVPGFWEGIKLLPHQIVGMAWMKDRETGKKAGGILADDMGCVQRRIVQSIPADFKCQSRQDDSDTDSHRRGKTTQI